MDVATGAVFAGPVSDCDFEGLVPLRFSRSYNSLDRREGGDLGHGWSHSFAWEVVARRRFLDIYQPGRPRLEVSQLKVGESTMAERRILTRTPEGLTLKEGALRHFFVAEPDGRCFSLRRIADGWGSGLRVEHERGQLARIIDDMGRVVEVLRDGSGRIASLRARNPVSQQILSIARFEYDRQGMLTCVTDAEDYATRYAYDDERRLVRQERPDGLRFHYVYDRSGRAIETWGDYVDGDRSLAPDVAATLADGETTARGVHHCRIMYSEGYTEVYDSQKVERFYVGLAGEVTKVDDGGAVHTRQYDEQGYLVGYTDPTLATTRFDRNALGQVVRITNPVGASTTFSRSGGGDLAAITDPEGGVTQIEYLQGGMQWRDSAGGQFVVVTDGRGRIVRSIGPNGGTTQHRFNGAGQEHLTILPGGRPVLRQFDDWGRCTMIKRGPREMLFLSYDRCGRVTAVTSGEGHRTRFAYDGAGNLIARIDAAGRCTRYEWGGLHRLCAVHHPDESVERFGYDREGYLVDVENGKGKHHRYERDGRGLVVREETFDGRCLRYRYDLAGRLVCFVNGEREKTLVEYDAAGRVMRIVYHDDSEDLFEYDLRGLLVKATSGDTEIRVERDEAGRPVREFQRWGERVETVSRTFDEMGWVAGRETSHGHRANWKRDVTGMPTEVVLDDAIIRQWRDVLGRRRRLSLPRGGVVEVGYDPARRIEEVTVIPAGAAAHTVGTAPDWIGERPKSASVHYRWVYAPDGELLQRWSREGEDVYGYDPVGQLVEVMSSGAERRTFTYDGARNRFESTPGAVDERYDEAGRLVQRGDEHFVWDDDGRLLRIEVGGVPSVSFRWNYRGLLAAVERRDECRVEFVYDAFSRRLAKKTFAPAGPGLWRLVAVADYVWDDSSLVHVIERRTGRAPVTHTFWLDNGTGRPRAHRLQSGESAAEWSHVVASPTGEPLALVDGLGRPWVHHHQGPWGEDASDIPLGFAGQHLDSEIEGLAYNHFRYYHARLGRYISPDPLGLDGGLNPYVYAANAPTYRIDPQGLMPHTVIYDRNNNILARGSSIRSGGGAQHNARGGHASVVAGALRDTRDYVRADGTIIRGDRDRDAGPCAEAQALSNLEQSVRSSGIEDEDAVRAEMQRRMAGGRIETVDDDGNAMAPCPKCARTIDHVTRGMSSAPTVESFDGTNTQRNQGQPPDLQPRLDDPERTAALHEGTYTAPPPPPPETVDPMERPINDSQRARVPGIRKGHSRDTAGMTDQEVFRYSNAGYLTSDREYAARGEEVGTTDD